MRLVLKSVFHLSLRTTQGFLESVVTLIALDLPVPDYSTVSRRQSALDVGLAVRPGDRSRHVVIDATGLKIYGDGQWNVRKHRSGRRRTWRKLHLGVDETTKEIVAVELTWSSTHHSRVLPAVLAAVPGDVHQVSGDGAYDTRACYESIGKRGALAIIPSRRNAEPWKPIPGADSALLQTDLGGTDCASI